jgi:hypothetical protein
MAEVAIAAFAGLENAKPTALAVVPPGFQSPRAAPGDVLIGLSWPGGGKVPVIGRYTPSAAGGDPNVHTAIAEAPGLGSEWKGLRLGAIDFAPDGSSVYVLPHAKDFFLELDPAFELRKRVVPGGAELKKLDTLAVSPRDGRLWVGEDARDEVWSLDPVTFEARLEFTFIKEGVQDGMGQAVDFHPPTMRFSRDGRRLVMSDVNGWVWVLGWY